MPELTADFIRDGGTYMVLGAKGGLHSGHLNRVQRNMLSSVSVPNLLRLDVREVDFEVSLHYEITGKRMLSQCLKQDKITMPELYNLLMQIAEALDECKQFMLSPLNFYLDENFIFVEDPLSSGILYFTYLPFCEPLSDESPAKALTGLITKMITCVSSMEGGGIQQLLRFCSDELFSLPEFKNLLVRLMTKEDPAATGVSGFKGPEKLGCRPDLRSPAVTIKEYVPEQNIPSPASDFYPSMANIREGEACFSSQAGAENDRPVSPPSGASRLNTYILAGMGVTAALLWKIIYFDNPTSLNRNICLAATILLITAALLLGRGKCRWLSLFGGQKRGGGDESDDELKTNENEINGAPSWDQSWRWNEPFEPELAIASPLVHDGSKQSYNAWNRPEPDPPEAGHAAGMPPLPAQRTVLLREPAAPDRLSPKAASFSLERRQGEQGGQNPETIILGKGSFIIGRSEEMCQYVDGAPGVSRAHVELMVLEEGCSLKDLGSRNGTILRGELIAPYKSYPMNPGDSFIIADCTYTLRQRGLGANLD
ncbi:MULTISPECIES: DUF6382 domain-containing protein [Paenibacillus]|uniref:DUF6382 domain-containing protein n=1 Tax=Paenibacillus TaxID=44249 RepID=UPI002FE37511